MKFEAIDKPLRLLLSDPDREIVLYPGQPLDFPPGLASKLLRQARGKVRVVMDPEADWLTLWYDVAEMSDGLTSTDPRLPEVLRAIEKCDVAFARGNKAAFLLGVEAVSKAMEGVPEKSAKS